MFRSSAVLVVLLAVSVLGSGVSCVSSEVDPRCTVEAPNQRYQDQLAQSINRSKLWQTYFDLMMPVKEGAEPLVSVEVEFGRNAWSQGGQGDYDPGEVEIYFLATNLMNGSKLWEEKRKIQLDDVIFGFFDGTETREEIQDIAFKEAEEDFFPFIDRWINLAAIRAMRQEGSSAFVSILEEQMEDPWADDLAAEAKWALKEIRGAQ